jgi:exopolysaccharide biosynthesis operon protein EpsL
MKEKYGSRTVKGVRVAVLAAINVLCGSAIAAQPGDVFVPYVEYSSNYYDNLLRLQDESVALSRFGSTKLSDTYTTAVGGMRFDQTWGRQHVTADLSENSNHYDHFSQYDYVGKDGRANWNWVLGNRLQGNLASTYTQSLVPFTDNIVVVQNVRNIRTQRTNSADLAWLIHPSWRLRTAYARYDLVYSSDEQGANDQRSDTAELGLSYLARSGSNIGLVFRNIRGSYDGLQIIGDQSYNNNYVQKELKVSVNWLVTGKSRLQFLGGPVQRKREYFTSRDYSGFNARLTATTQSTGKLSLNASLWRELGALDDLDANYALTDGVSFAPGLLISSKFYLDGSATYQRLDYSGAQVIEGLTPSSRRDTYQRTAVDLIYRAGPSLSLTTTVSREVRDSNLTNFSYRANGVSLRLRYEY